MTPRAHDERTTETMYDTAEELERSEAALHGVAERSPDEATRHRIHELADAVTREAKKIQGRADALVQSPVSSSTTSDSSAPEATSPSA